MKFSRPYWFLLTILIVVLTFSVISGSQIRKEGFREGVTTKPPTRPMSNDKLPTRPMADAKLPTRPMANAKLPTRPMYKLDGKPPPKAAILE